MTPSPPADTPSPQSPPSQPGITALGTLKALAEHLSADPDLVLNLSYIPSQGFQARLRSSAGLKASTLYPNLHTALQELTLIVKEAA